VPVGRVKGADDISTRQKAAVRYGRARSLALTCRLVKSIGTALSWSGRNNLLLSQEMTLNSILDLLSRGCDSMEEFCVLPSLKVVGLNAM